MAENRGKKFEKVIREAFEKVPDISIDRLHDQTTGFKGSQNICDFIVYKKPYEFYIECKSVRGASLPFSNITNTQYSGLLEKSKIPGVYAGIICWFIDKDVTVYIPIQILSEMRYYGKVRSVNYLFRGYGDLPIIEIPAVKKRVFFDYDMGAFLNEFV